MSTTAAPSSTSKRFATRWLRRAVVAGAFAATASWPLWSGSLGLAQEGGGSSSTPDAKQTREMLDRYNAAAEPGAKHELLNPLVGTFAATAVYTGPQGALTSQGTSTNTMILGGRFLKQDYVGRLDDREFHGMTLVGYDNVTGGYQSTMCDEASTALFYMEGSADADGRTFTFSGQAGDPISGEVKAYRHVLKVESDKKHTLEMYEPDKNSQLQKTVVITYERIADAPATTQAGE